MKNHHITALPHRLEKLLFISVVVLVSLTLVV